VRCASTRPKSIYQKKAAAKQISAQFVMQNYMPFYKNLKAKSYLIQEICRSSLKDVTETMNLKGLMVLVALFFAIL